MPDEISLTVGQRVRINEEEDPATHVGKMALVERLEHSPDGKPLYVLRVDRVVEPLTLPRRYLEPVVTTPASLLANDLFLPWDLDDPNRRLRMYLEDSKLAGHILETLLFYDRIVIPTVDFSIVVPLRHWLGARLFYEMLESEAISFVRYAGCLGYVGNGNGLALFEIQPSEKPDEWWIRTARCSPTEAVALHLQHRLSGLQEQEGEFFGRYIELCTIDTALPQFVQKVEEETYQDILGSNVLTSLFAVRNTDLKWLAGVGPNQMRTYSRFEKPAVSGDEIDTTLRLAMLNLEAYLAEESGARDMVADIQFDTLLQAKVQRFTGGKVARESFSKLVNLERLPDIASTISSGEADSFKVWEFRNTQKAAQFRQWFDEAGPSNPDELVQEYVAALRSSGYLGSRRAKIIRFIVVQGLSFLVGLPTLGLASPLVSAVDSFLLKRIFQGYNPRYFIDDLRPRLIPGK